ncbi:MAG: 30S ribosomal protein S2 [Lentisphaeria bacterium]
MQKVTVQDLMEAGVHFGHQTKRWNPKMKPYVYGVRHGVTVFDLGVTIRKLAEACDFLRNVAQEQGSILFVGTKRQAQNLMREAAEKTGSFHMCHRWLGGTLTNNKVVMSRVKRLNELRRMEAESEIDEMPNKEAAAARRELGKLERILGGIADMKKLPDVMVVADIERDDIAVKEAVRLNIPVVAIVDSNCNPDPVDYVVPGNDDAVRSLKVILNVLAAAVIDGKTQASKNEEEAGESTEEVTAHLSAAKEAAASDVGSSSEGALKEGKEASSETTESKAQPAADGAAEETDAEDEAGKKTEKNEETAKAEKE